MDPHRALISHLWSKSVSASWLISHWRNLEFCRNYNSIWCVSLVLAYTSIGWTLSFFAFFETWILQITKEHTVAFSSSGVPDARAPLTAPFFHRKRCASIGWVPMAHLEFPWVLCTCEHCASTSTPSETGFDSSQNLASSSFSWRSRLWLLRLRWMVWPSTMVTKFSMQHAHTLCLPLEF